MTEIYTRIVATENKNFVVIHDNYCWIVVHNCDVHHLDTFEYNSEAHALYSRFTVPNEAGDDVVEYTFTIALFTSTITIEQM